MNFTMIDAVLTVILGLVAMAARLWTIAYPSEVIFDEVHFGNFSKWYVLNEFHFDIHPPLAKMLMGYIAKASQYKGDIKSFSKLRTPYPINESYYISQRQTPAIFSSMVAPLLFTAMRNLGISSYPSFGAGLMIALDSSMITESKFILSDGLLHFFTALHIAAFALFLRTQNPYHVLFAGITLGLAGSTKFTALGLVAVDGISQVIWILISWPTLFEIIKRATLLLAPCLSVMLIVWVVHFAMTPYMGFKSFRMNPQDKHTLIERNKINLYYPGNRSSNSNLLLRIFRWNKVMNKVNMRANCPHSWSSSPQYWPFLMDKMLKMYAAKGNREIYCFGLPAAYWFSTTSLILTPFLYFFHLADWRNLLMWLGWAVSYFPFLGIPRTMFHYHYLVPLMFAVMNLFALLENCFKNNRKAKGFVLTIIVFLDVSCFFYFTPTIYGTPDPNRAQYRTWSQRWMRGPPKPYHYYGKSLYNTSLIEQSLPV